MESLRKGPGWSRFRWMVLIWAIVYLAGLVASALLVDEATQFVVLVAWNPAAALGLALALAVRKGELSAALADEDVLILLLSMGISAMVTGLVARLAENASMDGTAALGILIAVSLAWLLVVRKAGHSRGIRRTGGP